MALDCRDQPLASTKEAAARASAVNEGNMRPMSEAPRDGTKIKLFRKPHPNRRFPWVVGWWESKNSIYWKAKTTTGSYTWPWDADLLGWEPLEQLNQEV